jgi:hypothetical protein
VITPSATASVTDRRGPRRDDGQARVDHQPRERAADERVAELGAAVLSQSFEHLVGPEGRAGRNDVGALIGLGQNEPSVGLEATRHLGDCLLGARRMDQHRARRAGVERVVRKRQALGVGTGDRAAGRVLRRGRGHRRRQVDSDGAPRPIGHRSQLDPRAAADVEHNRVRAESERVQRAIGMRTKLAAHPLDVASRVFGRVHPVEIAELERPLDRWIHASNTTDQGIEYPLLRWSGAGQRMLPSWTRSRSHS